MPKLEGRMEKELGGNERKNTVPLGNTPIWGRMIKNSKTDYVDVCTTLEMH